MALEKSSKIFLGVLVIAAGLVLGGLLAMNAVSGSDEGSGEPVRVEIPEGVGASEVATILDERGVIRSSTAFRLSARFDERSANIQPGTYELRQGMSTDEILEVITASPQAAPTFRVTIPEGLTVMQTLERIAQAEQSPFTVDDLTDALSGVALPEWVPDELPEGAEPYEGLLFPDTYEFRVESDPQDVLSRLIAETSSVLESIEPPEGYTRYEVLVAASLIERETRVRDEQPIVASVIYNRLDEPMPLQIDATVIYARGEHTTRVLHEDTRIDSAWNTYQHPGLPPTPISGAGRGAIEAAANPADTNYRYYVVSDLETGEHAFAETLDEHNENVQRFRALQREAEEDDG